jgi:Uncharacterized protein conserved in bacteria (DUF2313).
MNLIDLLPDYYNGCPQVVELQGTFGNWTDALLEAKSDLFSQVNVSTATWGLNIWEKTLGIEPDVSKPYAYRRSRIMSKLRGAGTTTIAMIQNVAESFSNGEVTIIEHNNENRFEVKFTGTIGMPPNMDDLTEAIEEIKPAHMSYSYIYIFTTNQTLHAYTHSRLSAYTHYQLRNEVIS